MHFTKIQLKEAYILVFLHQNMYEDIEDLGDEFKVAFKSNGEHQLAFANEKNEFCLIDPDAPWILGFPDGKVVVHYEGAYVGMFPTKEDGIIFKDKAMMAQDRDFSPVLARFFTLQ